MLDRNLIVVDLDDMIKSLQRHMRIAHSHEYQLTAELVPYLVNIRLILAKVKTNPLLTTSR